MIPGRGECGVGCEHRSLLRCFVFEVSTYTTMIEREKGGNGNSQELFKLEIFQKNTKNIDRLISPPPLPQKSRKTYDRPPPTPSSRSPSPSRCSTHAIALPAPTASSSSFPPLPATTTFQLPSSPGSPPPSSSPTTRRSRFCAVVSSTSGALCRGLWRSGVGEWGVLLVVGCMVVDYEEGAHECQAGFWGWVGLVSG